MVLVFQEPKLQYPDLRSLKWNKRTQMKKNYLPTEQIKLV